jgi:hypothetical protein
MAAGGTTIWKGFHVDFKLTHWILAFSHRSPFFGGFAQEKIWVSPFRFTRVIASGLMLSSGRVPGALMMIVS